MNRNNRGLLRKKLYILGLLIPAIFVFQAFLSGAPLSWGDAPYFHSEGLRELVSEPSIWTARGTVFGGVNQFLWFTPIMIIYGLLGNIFNLNNEVVIRLLFYIPSLLFSFVSPWIFVKHLKLSKTVAFFASLIYVFNTYYLLVVDGGQVGVALAYGLFPIVLIVFISLLEKTNKKSFIKSLIVGFIMSMIDPRFLIIAIIISLFWLRKIKNLIAFITVVFCILLLSSYWLIPLLGSHIAVSGATSDLHLVSLLNTLLLYQPHWSANQFGLVTSPPWYYALLPIIIFWGIFSNKKKYAFFGLMFLIIAFLAKGNTHPLGGYYQWIVNNIPFGSSLRDSTKFFAPLILFAGILIGITAEKLDKKYKYSLLTIYVFILFLVSPAIFGKLNFVLSGREYSADIKLINRLITDETGSFRVAWFPEKHPASYHTDQKQSFDAKYLADYEPFRSMNVGDYDKFNFTHNKQFVDWFKLFGIRYLILQPDPRVIELNKEEQRNFDDLKQRIATSSGLLKSNVTQELPLYKVADAKLKTRASDKLIAVIGSPQTISPNIPIVFFEDGKLNPLHLQNVLSESAVLYFDQKNQTDLEMSFLQKYFIPAINSKTSEWAKYDSSQNLKWRFEAIIRGVDTKEFDYGQGMAFSEKQGERLVFDIPPNQDYIIAVRTRAKDKNDNLMVSIDNIQKIITPSRDSFEWSLIDYKANSKQMPLIIENKSGFWLTSNIAIIPKKEWEKTQKLADTYIKHFKTITNTEFETIVSTNHWEDMDLNKTDINSLEAKPKWILYQTAYNQDWYFKNGNDYFSSLPAYSSLNLFYYNGQQNKLEFVFKGQQLVRWGIYTSTLTFLVLLIVYLYNLDDNNKIN